MGSRDLVFAKGAEFSAVQELDFENIERFAIWKGKLVVCRTEDADSEGNNTTLVEFSGHLSHERTFSLEQKVEHLSVWKENLVTISHGEVKVWSPALACAASIDDKFATKCAVGWGDRLATADEHSIGVYDAKGQLLFKISLAEDEEAGPRSLLVWKDRLVSKSCVPDQETAVSHVQVWNADGDAELEFESLSGNRVETVVWGDWLAYNSKRSIVVVDAAGKTVHKLGDRLHWALHVHGPWLVAQGHADEDDADDGSDAKWGSSISYAVFVWSTDGHCKQIAIKEREPIRTFFTVADTLFAISKNRKKKRFRSIIDCENGHELQTTPIDSKMFVTPWREHLLMSNSKAVEAWWWVSRQQQEDHERSRANTAWEPIYAKVRSDEVIVLRSATIQPHAGAGTKSSPAVYPADWAPLVQAFEQNSSCRQIKVELYCSELVQLLQALLKAQRPKISLHLTVSTTKITMEEYRDLWAALVSSAWVVKLKLLYKEFEAFDVGQGNQRVFADALAKNVNIKALDFSYAWTSDAIFEAITKNTALETLKLNSSTWAPADADADADEPAQWVSESRIEMLRQMRGLKRLVLKSITEELLARLVTSYLSSSDCTVRELKVTGLNESQRAGLSQLKDNASLTSVQIVGGGGAISGSVLEAVLREARSLERVDFEPPLSDDVTAEQYALFAASQTLTGISLGRITSKFVDAITQRQTSLDTLKFAASDALAAALLAAPIASNLRSLSVGLSGSSDAQSAGSSSAIETVASLVAKSALVSDLEFRLPPVDHKSNSDGDDPLSAVLDAVRFKTSLRRLRVTQVKSTAFLVGHGSLAELAIEAAWSAAEAKEYTASLAEAVKGNQSLLSVTLGGKAVPELEQLLKRNRGLRDAASSESVTGEDCDAFVAADTGADAVKAVTAFAAKLDKAKRGFKTIFYSTDKGAATVTVHNLDNAVRRSANIVALVTKTAPASPFFRAALAAAARHGKEVTVVSDGTKLSGLPAELQKVLSKEVLTLDEKDVAAKAVIAKAKPRKQGGQSTAAPTKGAAELKPVAAAPAANGKSTSPVRSPAASRPATAKPPAANPPAKASPLSREPSGNVKTQPIKGAAPSGPARPGTAKPAGADKSPSKSGSGDEPPEMRALRADLEFQRSLVAELKEQHASEVSALKAEIAELKAQVAKLSASNGLGSSSMPDFKSLPSIHSRPSLRGLGQ